MMEDIDWNVHCEGQLLDAMVGHKPVGVNKYFQMAVIMDKFTDHLNKDIHPDKVWEHLDTMYNLEALDESESLPFPNEEREFSLPESEFGHLQAKKEDKNDPEKKNNQKGRETPKNMKEIKKEEKTPVPIRNSKDAQRRDSKDSKDGNKPNSTKKEIKKDIDKSIKSVKGRNSLLNSDEKPLKSGKVKNDDTPRTGKRPTRGSLKPDDTGSNGKASPLTVTPNSSKRRRVQ